MQPFGLTTVNKTYKLKVLIYHVPVDDHAPVRVATPGAALATWLEPWDMMVDKISD